MNYSLKHVYLRCFSLLFVLSSGQGCCTQRRFVKTRLKRDLNIDFRDTSEKMRPQFGSIETGEVFPE